jgi:hypothetical protein
LARAQAELCCESGLVVIAVVVDDVVDDGAMRKLDYMCAVCCGAGGLHGLEWLMGGRREGKLYIVRGGRAASTRSWTG